MNYKLKNKQQTPLLVSAVDHQGVCVFQALLQLLKTLVGWLLSLAIKDAEDSHVKPVKHCA
jgi:hypothetical protein